MQTVHAIFQIVIWYELSFYPVWVELGVSGCFVVRLKTKKCGQVYHFREYLKSLTLFQMATTVMKIFNCKIITLQSQTSKNFWWMFKYCLWYQSIFTTYYLKIWAHGRFPDVVIIIFYFLEYFLYYLDYLYLLFVVIFHFQVLSISI